MSVADELMMAKRLIEKSRQTRAEVSQSMERFHETLTQLGPDALEDASYHPAIHGRPTPDSAGPL